jgi:hypothetical protein
MRGGERADYKPSILNSAYFRKIKLHSPRFSTRKTIRNIALFARGLPTTIHSWIYEAKRNSAGIPQHHSQLTKEREKCGMSLYLGEDLKGSLEAPAGVGGDGDGLTPGKPHLHPHLSLVLGLSGDTSTSIKDWP